MADKNKLETVVNINNYGNSSIKVRKSKNSDGNIIIDIIIERRGN